MDKKSPETLTTNTHKKPIEKKYATIVICLLIFAAILYFIFPYIWQCRNLKNYAEIQKIIASFPDTINEPLNIPEKENGRYWFALAGLENKETDKKYDKLIDFLKNNFPKSKIEDDTSKNSSITFKNTDAAVILKIYAADLELLKKGSSCNFFQQEYSGKNTNFKHIVLCKELNFMLARSFQQLYWIKAVCEINNNEYDKAAETIDESFKFAISFHRNHILSDKKTMIPAMVEINLTSFPCNSLKYLLEKSNKSYPQLTETIKKVKKEFSDEEIKQVYDAELTYILVITDGAINVKAKKEFKKGDCVYILFTGMPDISPQSWTDSAMIYILSYWYRGMQHNLFENHKFITNYIDTKDPQILDKIEKYNKPAHPFANFNTMGGNYIKVLKQFETTQKKVNALEKELENRL